jgi:hypothetical protein
MHKLLATLTLAALAITTATPNPAADPAAVVNCGRARFAVLSPTFLRLEYAASRVFSDAATLQVVNRRFAVPPFSVARPNASACVISTAALTLTFDDVDGDSAPDCGAARAGTDKAAGARLPAFPDGARAADAGACCALCAAARGCAAWVFDESRPPAPAATCWPLATLGGTRPAANRTLGAGPGGFGGSLTIVAAGNNVTWTPSARQAANLGGTLSHMDCYSTPTQCYAEYGAAVEPGLLARDGWSVLDDSATARYAPPAAGGIPWWQNATGGGADLYFSLYGADLRGALTAAAALMGAVELPPRSSFGVWWSQNYPFTNTTGNMSIATAVLDEYGARGIPLTVLVLDMDWHRRHVIDSTCSTWGSWDWNETAFPDPAAFTAWVGSAQSPVGHPLALTLNVHPQSGVDHCMTRYLDFAARIGFDTSTNATSPCDMGNATWVAALWDTYYSAAPLDRVSWWWTDYTGVGGPPGSELLWSNLVYAAQREARAGLRPMTFSRWGGLGGHRSPIQFSGDTFQHELTLDFEIEMTAQAGNSLAAYWSHDLGGFHADGTTAGHATHCPGDSDPANATGAALLTRWLQFGALSPVMRTHCGGCGPEGLGTCACERRIWLFPSHYAFMRDAMLLRAALVPYLYTAARATYDSGISFARKPYIDWPLEPLAYSRAFKHEYALGDALLVSPISDVPSGVGDVAAAVWLPPGCWAPWAGGPAVVGGTVDTRDYGVGDVPIFARCDALLPLAAGGAAGVADTSPAIEWTLFAAAASAVGASAGSGGLYEDDGASVAFRAAPSSGDNGTLFTRAAFAWAGAAASLVVNLSAPVGGYEGAPAERSVSIAVRGWTAAFGGALPTAVRVDGADVPRGDGAMTWSVTDAPPGAPALAVPAGTLVVRAGARALRAGAVFEVVR